MLLGGVTAPLPPLAHAVVGLLSLRVSLVAEGLIRKAAVLLASASLDLWVCNCSVPLSHAVMQLHPCMAGCARICSCVTRLSQCML